MRLCKGSNKDPLVIVGPLVIIGLGNPGKKYEMTRHNMGYIALHALAKELGWTFKEEKRFHAYIAKGEVSSKDEKKEIYLLLPTTYMNLSGTAVKAFLDYHKLGLKNLLVVSDDIDLNFGSLRLKPKGSAGGHNGLKSIESSLATIHYARLRMGIGRDSEEDQLRSDVIKKRSLTDYVLDTFSQEELQALPSIIEKAVSLLQFMFTAEISAAMQKVNAKEKLKISPSTGLGEKKHESN